MGRKLLLALFLAVLALVVLPQPLTQGKQTSKAPSSLGRAMGSLNSTDVLLLQGDVYKPSMGDGCGGTILVHSDKLSRIVKTELERAQCGLLVESHASV